MASSFSSSKKCKPHRRGTNDLIDLVFSWSLEDILNQDFYKNQVEKIPDSFQSVDHYLGAYTFPLLEETRAELCSTMELILEAPYAEIISLQEAKPCGSFLYDLKVEPWKNTSCAGGNESYKPKTNDVFLVCDVVPESVTDLEQFGWSWSLGLVTKVSENENLNTDSNHSSGGDVTTHYKVKTSKAVEVKEGMRNSVYAVFLINLTTNNRIWNALHMFGNLEMIKEVLCTNSLVEETCSLCSLRTNSILADGFGTITSSTLNESQTDAVLGSISTMQCKHKSSVKLIWGPPGTGKTKTVSTLLCTLLKMNSRVLTTAPTNVAVTEVASRVLKLVKETYNLDRESVPPFCSLGDLLLFGNKEKLNVLVDLEDIYIDYRVDRLVECFAPLSGWKYCFTSTMDFLEECSSEYHTSLENDTGRESETGHGVRVSFLEFTRNRYKATASSLKRCISILCTHLPMKFILQQNFESMVYLFNLLESFGNLLFQIDFLDIELEAIFSPTQGVGNTCSPSMEIHRCGSFTSNASAMYKIRSTCIDVLRSLHCTLNDLGIPNIMGKGLVREYCFQNASLIFCTASSSYKLHKVKMEPLDMLVVDEAALLKECDATIPLQLPGIRHAVLIGDECQLPAMVKSKVSNAAGFGRSLFERLSLLGHSKHLLNMQYRMHPKISSFPNAKFYLKQILDAPNVLCKSYERQYLPGHMFGPYSFISISMGKEEFDDIGHSINNLVEAAVAVKIVRNLFKAWHGSGSQKLTIGIISPYASQVVVIQEKLGQKYENLDGFVVRVKSIDGFQGGEEDIIIISTVRSNRGGEIGFVSDPQRTIVALTRAKHNLWILGNGTTLSSSKSCWASLVRDAKDRHCFYNADEDKDLAKAILRVKEELDQLDGLLDRDSILFKNARWKVLFSDNFRKSFGRLKSSQTQKSVINLLLRLSSGWRPKRRTIDCVYGNSLQLVNRFKVRELYLIATVDVMKYSCYVQVLKIWDILPLEEIPKLVKRLDDIFGMYTDEFVNHCKLRHIEGNLEVPFSWESCDATVQYKNLTRTDMVSASTDDAFDGRSYVENSKVSESLLLMKFYSLSSGVVNHLLSGRDGKELDLPFEVTEQEFEIILFPRSTFILGRSGTGKTTVLTMKLFQKEQQHYLSSEGFSEVRNDISMGVPEENNTSEGFGILRQIFVTVSPKLCSAVKNHVSNMKSLARGGNSSAKQKSVGMHDMDDAIEFKDIPDCFMDIPPKSYPLVITFQKFMMMLDGSMESSYFDRFSDIDELSVTNTRISRSFALQAFIKRKEVKYDRFHSFYWPHFNSQLTKKLDSSAVFIEIISHIKGGLNAGRVPEGKLSREEYALLCEGRISSFNREKREMIYDIFLDYEKEKMQNDEFDLADFIIDLHSRLRNGRNEIEKVDFVYIDEVQDLTMRQIALFKYVCKNFNEGFVFCGDTAQTIARGVDFRFQDIRSLFYKEFLLDSESDGKNKAKEKDRCRISDIFHLSQNFRTHAGVLNLAQSVIDLLYCFFPHSIDVLSPETSRIYGEAPVLLESGNNENVIVTIFGKSGNSRNMVGFGAEQVILVRDNGAKKEIADHVGKQALVLTIVECKGLEFQDVLLYNFFGTSPLKNQWRVVYGYMKQQNLLDSAEAKFPTFSKAKHNILCSELKQLYVAITRTRQRLWVCENVDDFAKPMFDYWKNLGIVQVRLLDESLAQAMEVVSSKEEWSLRGIKLFKEGNFEMATMCFERAGDLCKEKWARAAGLRASTEQMRSSNPELARVALTQAAEIYETIGKAELAAECLIELKEFERAGHLYLDKCGESRLEHAGDCFSLSGCWSLAAEVYSRGKFFSKCLEVCTNGNLFDMGLHFIEYWKETADLDADTTRSEELKDMEQSFLEKYALHFHELKDTDRMMKFVRAFKSRNFIRTFLMTWNYLDELVLLEGESELAGAPPLGPLIGVKSCNFVKAASIARLKGDLLLEADMLEKAGHFEDASKVILFYVLSNSLWAEGSKGWPMKQFSNKEELLTKAKLLAKNKPGTFYEFICMEATVISNQESRLSDLGKCSSASQSLKSLCTEILSSRKILDVVLRILPSNYEWEHRFVLNPMKHAEDMISRNVVSVETLIYFWNLWREKILNLLSYLSSLGSQHESDFKSYGEFCLHYLGVCRQEHNQSSIYLVLHSDAYWMREINDRALQKERDMVYMDAQQYVFAARSYWVSEVLSVGMEVLETLEALHKFSLGNSYSLFFQGMIILHIFEVTNQLLESGVLDKKYPWALKNYLALCRKHFFIIVCPLQWNQMMAENMIALRGTMVFRDLLKEVIIEDARSEAYLTHGQIGRMVTMIFVSGNLTDELLELISTRFHVYSPWKSFIVQLKEYMVSGLVQEALVCKYQEAIQDTFNANWRKEFDYISPCCFIYLLERLLFLVSSCQGFFFTTKSSLIESLTSENWICNSNKGSHSDMHMLVRRSHDFIAEKIHQILFDIKETLEWFDKTDIASKKYLSLLVLRAIVLLSLICLQSGQYFMIYNLLSRQDVCSLLPQVFYQTFRGRRKQPFPKVLGEALRAIGNPLVLLNSRNNRPKFFFPNAIVVDMDVLHCSEDVLGVLIPKKPEGSDLPDQGIQLLENENEWRDLQMSYKTFWDTFEALKSGKKGKNGNAKNFDFTTPKMKMGVQQSIHVLGAAVKKLTHCSSPGGKDKSLADDAETMLGELNQLSTALSVSGKELEQNITAVCELFGKLQGRKSRLQPWLDSLFLPTDHTKTPATDSSSQVTVPSGTEDNRTKGKENQKSKVELHPSSDLPNQGIQLLENENEWKDLQMSYKTFWDALDALKSGEKGKNGNAKIFASTASKMKMGVEKSIHVLVVAVNRLTHNSGPGDKDKSLAGDAEIMLVELMQLFTALNVSGRELEQNFTLVRELLGKLQGRKSRLQPWLDSLFLPTDTKIPATDFSSQVTVPSGTQDNRNKRKENQKSKKGNHKGKGKRK